MEIRGLEAWLTEFEKNKGMGLAAVVRKLNDLTSSDESSAAELAEVILKDSSLSAQVIRVANSIHFNPQHIAITTISRAIFQIGFDTIKSICISIKMLEVLLKSNPPTELVEVIAQTTHAAVQARNLCRKARAKTREEVFVSAMLLNLAELIVLSTPATNVHELSDQYTLDLTRKDKDRLAEKYIGVSFTRLAISITKRWNLGKLLLEVLQPGQEPSGQSKAIIWGERISLAARKGWNSSAFQMVQKELANETGQSAREVADDVIAGAKEAREIAVRYGNKALVAQMPSTDKAPRSIDIDESLELLKPSKARQLEITKDLNSMIMSGCDMNTVFQSILEGLHHGVGLERVAMAIFDRNREYLEAKHVLGEQTATWKNKFRFTYDNSGSNFFYAIFQGGEPLKIHRKSELVKLVPSELTKLAGVQEFLIAPLAVGDKRVGVLYGDMGDSQRSLDDNYESGFSHFSQQANVCLAVIANRSTQPAKR